jgi:hypothetical protein
VAKAQHRHRQTQAWQKSKSALERLVFQPLDPQCEAMLSGEGFFGYPSRVVGSPGPGSVAFDALGDQISWTSLKSQGPFSLSAWFDASMLRWFEGAGVRGVWAVQK